VPVSEIAAGVFWATLGRGVMASNVYFVGADPSWFLIDAGWRDSGEAIGRVAESLFGSDSRPAAIVLTHIHPDHSGAARQLALRWGVPVLVHSAELPLAGGRIVPRYANPLDRWILGPILRLVPPKRLDRMLEAGALTDVVRGTAPELGVAGLPGWQCIPTPGHTPGHVAFHRPSDGVLFTGDAVLTVDLNSVVGVVRATTRAAGPPRYTTWSWPAATDSITTLATLRPSIIAPGHGRPVAAGAADALDALAVRLKPGCRGTPAPRP
jgi:glyoxylase-like metal-dependent hydrolase (beta-lactamase superfamily II)